MKSNSFTIKRLPAILFASFIMWFGNACGSEDMPYLKLNSCTDEYGSFGGPRSICGGTYLNGKSYNLLCIDELVRTMVERRYYEFQNIDKDKIEHANVEKIFSNIEDSPQSRIYVLTDSTYSPKEYLNLVFLIEDSVLDGIYFDCSRDSPIFLHLQRLKYRTSGTAELKIPEKLPWWDNSSPGEWNVWLSFKDAAVYKVTGHHNQLQERIWKWELEDKIKELDKINQKAESQIKERDKHVTEYQKRMAEQFYENWKKDDKRELVNRVILIPVLDVNLSDGLDEQEIIRLGSIMKDSNEMDYAEQLANFPRPNVSAVKSNDVNLPAMPFMAKITGNNVNVRSGPGTNYYFCGKLQKGDKINVVGSKFSWWQITPPAGSYAWISRQYVETDPQNSSVGTVISNGARVYAGSDEVQPMYSTAILVKLNKNDKVTLLGEEKEGYCKITPPEGSYLYVSSVYAKALSSLVTPVQPTPSSPNTPSAHSPASAPKAE